MCARGGVVRPLPGARPPARFGDVSSREREETPSGAGRARLPPRWFVVTFWHVHRMVVNLTRGRVGLWRPKPGKWGALRLETVGRHTGRPRPVLVGYFEDGDNLVTMAMNGWGAAEPAWWLNLQAQPDVTARHATAPGRCTPAAPWATNGHGCGRAGPRSTMTSTRTRPAARARPPSSSSSHTTEPARRRVDGAEPAGPVLAVSAPAWPPTRDRPLPARRRRGRRCPKSLRRPSPISLFASISSCVASMPAMMRLPSFIRFVVSDPPEDCPLELLAWVPVAPSACSSEEWAQDMLERGDRRDPGDLLERGHDALLPLSRSSWTVLWERTASRGDA